MVKWSYFVGQSGVVLLRWTVRGRNRPRLRLWRARRSEDRHGPGPTGAARSCHARRRPGAGCTPGTASASSQSQSWCRYTASYFSDLHSRSRQDGEQCHHSVFAAQQVRRDLRPHAVSTGPTHALPGSSRPLRSRLRAATAAVAVHRRNGGEKQPSRRDNSRGATPGGGGRVRVKMRTAPRPNQALEALGSLPSTPQAAPVPRTTAR